MKQSSGESLQKAALPQERDVPGRVLWITGYSSAGKTTVARKVTLLLKEAGHQTVFLDGDDLRRILGNKWGYDKEERVELAHVYLRMCSHLASQGLTVVISAVAMYDSVFDWFDRNIVNPFLVYLEVPEDVRSIRDRATKKVYDKILRDAPAYDVPRNGLRIANHGQVTPDQAAAQIVRSLPPVVERSANANRTTYWDGFYRDHEGIMSPSSFAEFVIREYLHASADILEVGCGNGRDSAFFTQLGHRVLGIDPSASAIDLCTRLHANANAEFKCTTADRLRSESRRFDAVYCRFVLHAMTAHEQQDFFEAASVLLKRGGLLLIECRSVNDPMMLEGEVISPTERIHGHYRRFIDRDALLASLARNAFSVDYAIEGRGLAALGNDDPVVIRVAAKK